MTTPSWQRFASEAPVDTSIRLDTEDGRLRAVALIKHEAAMALGVSVDFFERHVMPSCGSCVAHRGG
jgi:hypothetical protein